MHGKRIIDKIKRLWKLDPDSQGIYSPGFNDKSLFSDFEVGSLLKGHFGSFGT
jgi:hypothetical protein